MKAEYDRRTVLDGRGLAVVTTSGTFVTLLFALTTFVTGKDYKPDTVGKWSIAVALGLFVVAGLIGIFANAARTYQVADEATLRLMVTAHWTDTESDARNACAVANIETVGTLRTGNNTKADILTGALVVQVLAIAALGVALMTQIV